MARARFLHMADCHLGYRQYNSRDRYNDFTRAFISVVRTAVEEAVDFVVLAGDLFEKRTIDALTLAAAMRGLERLKDAGIPCIAVEGNHELSHYSEALGWMEFLAERGLLILLSPTFHKDGVELPAYEKRSGAYYEPVEGIRVYGMRYLGSGTATAVERMAAALTSQAERADYTILIAHTGVEGVLPGESGGLSHRQLAPLRPSVDYLALGHIHKPFDFDGWIYNPGSLETCSMTEAAWPERGFYLVEVDTEREREADEPAHRVALHSNPRRPFVRLRFATDHTASPEDLYLQCAQFVERKARDAGRQSDENAPVVELRLTGVLPFDRAALELERLDLLVRTHFSPVLCHVRNATQPSEYAVTTDAQLDRKALERQIISDLLERDVRFRGESERWTEFVLGLKDLVLKGTPPSEILNEVSRFTSPDLIQGKEEEDEETEEPVTKPDSTEFSQATLVSEEGR